MVTTPLLPRERVKDGLSEDGRIFWPQKSPVTLPPTNGATGFEVREERTETPDGFWALLGFLNLKREEEEDDDDKRGMSMANREDRATSMSIKKKEETKRSEIERESASPQMIDDVSLLEWVWRKQGRQWVGFKPDPS